MVPGVSYLEGIGRDTFTNPSLPTNPKATPKFSLNQLVELRAPFDAKTLRDTNQTATALEYSIASIVRYTRTSAAST